MRVNIIDENKIAQRYKIKIPATFKIDKEAIKKDKKAGKAIGGGVTVDNYDNLQIK